MDGFVNGPDVGRRTRAQRDTDVADYMAARQPALLRTAYLLTGDRTEAEDLVRTTLAKLYLYWDEDRSPDRLDAHVRRIMVDAHTSTWRRRWRRRVVTVDRVPDTAPFRDAHDFGEGACLWDAVRALPSRQRAVLVLRYYEDLSEAEIAAALGVSVGIVKSQASRGMAALRARVPLARAA